MMKKLLSFVCCLLPVGAWAGVTYTETTGADGNVTSIATHKLADGYSDNYSEASPATVATFNPTGSNVIGSGGGISSISTSDISLNVIGDVATALTISGAGGLNVTQNLTFGSQASSVGNMGIDVNSDSFTINSAGAIKVGGDIEFAKDKERSLVLQGNGAAVDVTVDGTTIVNGQFTAANVRAFKSGAISVDNTVAGQDSLTINAATIDTGAINVTGGNVDLVATGKLKMAQLQTFGDNTKISADSIESGSIQNGMKTVATDTGTSTSTNTTSKMTITLAGDLQSSGNIENSGQLMEILTKEGTAAGAVNVTVDGTMKNDSPNGTLTMVVDSLKVNGGSATKRSFVNAGNLNLTVAGEIYLAHGFDLSAMQYENTFQLKTGTLKFGDTNAADAWLDVFANDLNKFYLEYTNDKVSAGTILNGAKNSKADMSVIGLSVDAASVTNKGGTLLVKGTSNASTDSVSVTGNVQGDAGTTTDIISAGVLNVAGNVSNSGKMLLNGNDVRLNGVSNVGNELKISSLTDATGKIKITSSVTNGTQGSNDNDVKLIVNAKQIDIDGIVTNYNGTTDIKGSNGGASTADGIVAGVSLGGVNVLGGQFKLDALAGIVSVDGAISVEKGVLNIGQSTHNLTAGQSIQISGDVNLRDLAPITGNGDVNIAATDTAGFVLASTAVDSDGKDVSAITIEGNVSAVDSADARSAQFDAKTITVKKNVYAENKGKLIFGSPERAAQTVTNTKITGDASAKNGGTLEFYSDDVDVGSLLIDRDSLLIVHGSQITANTGALNVNGDLWFTTTDSNITSGMIVRDTKSLTLETSASGGSDISIAGGVTLNTGNTLTLKSAHDVTIGGRVTDGSVFSVISSGALSVNAAQNVIFENKIKTNNSLTVSAQNITTKDIENTDKMTLGDGTTSTVTTGVITNSGTSEINATTVNTAAITSTAGAFDVIADSMTTTGDINVSGGTATLDVTTIVAKNSDIDVSGDLVQGGAKNAGMLNIVRDGTVSAKRLKVGAFNAVNKSVEYSLSSDVTVGGAFDVVDTADVTMVTDGNMTIGQLVNGQLTNGTLTNAGELELTVNGTGGLQIGGAIANSGNLKLTAVNGVVSANSFVDNTGTVILKGKGMTLSGAFGADVADDISAADMPDMLSMLYHGGTQVLVLGDFRIANNLYILTASNVALAGIKQTATGLTIKTSDLKIKNDIDVVDMRVAANPADDWLKVDVGGNVIGGAQFIGLESMVIGGNYKFTNKSQINAVILPYAKEVGPNTTTNNYWSKISLNDDNTLGQITNAVDGAALIQVKQAFISSADDFDVAVNNGKLSTPQIGLVLRDVVDPGTAIWLLHAENGVSDESITAKIRNLNVSFCNDSGSLCLDYLEAINKYNKSDTDLPAYISVRDSAGDGFADSLYVVFDPRFGGPVEVFKIQPIVGRVDDHTAGEYATAGALDDMIAGRLAATGFYNRTPIEAIPLIFKNTNMETAATELYKRMEYYNLERDGESLARFSRLFQPREVEQLAGSISLNEHTNFRSFEDRMFDEFIWNRYRNLKKAWLDVDYGLFYQDATDGKHIDGNRFNIAGGFDWQESQTLLLGLTGRVSRMSSDNFDDIDLGYLPGQHIAGNVKTTVSDTDIGLGGYLMKILGQKTRVYGNGFLDIHMLDVERDQTYVSKISGSGTTFSLMSEWGLLHDWLNQYIVGNMYARAGYTSGFDITEKAAGQDYMNLKSDGYFTFTPGYSLTAQKRIYPSVWFQVRPYATIGVEYDVLGAPDSVKYEFAAAGNYTTYDINIDPLWANIGGGVEMLSVTGVQVGIDYRYQYNADMQLHNIRISGSYRF